MKYVPDSPRVVLGETGSLDAHPLTTVKPAKPVQPRSLPPLVVHRPTQAEISAAEAVQHQERRHLTTEQSERRTYCRRIEHPVYLLELRSRLERRRHTQREGDAAEHVDEEV